MLILTVPTRWYTHFNFCDTLLKAKYAVTLLRDENTILNAISTRESVSKFKCIIDNSQFWAHLKEIRSVLSFPTSIIGKYENDSSDLSIVYDYFMQLSSHWTKIDNLDENDVQKLNLIVWNVIHASLMGFAYMLTPSSAKKPWAASGTFETKRVYWSFSWWGRCDHTVQRWALVLRFFKRRYFSATTEWIWTKIWLGGFWHRCF